MGVVAVFISLFFIGLLVLAVLSSFPIGTTLRRFVREVSAGAGDAVGEAILWYSRRLRPSLMRFAICGVIGIIVSTALGAYGTMGKSPLGALAIVATGGAWCLYLLWEWLKNWREQSLFAVIFAVPFAFISHGFTVFCVGVWVESWEMASVGAVESYLVGCGLMWVVLRVLAVMGVKTIDLMEGIAKSFHSFFGVIVSSTSQSPEALRAFFARAPNFADQEDFVPDVDWLMVEIMAPLGLFYAAGVYIHHPNALAIGFGLGFAGFVIGILQRWGRYTEAEINERRKGAAGKAILLVCVMAAVFVAPFVLPLVFEPATLADLKKLRNECTGDLFQAVKSLLRFPLDYASGRRGVRTIAWWGVLMLVVVAAALLYGAKHVDHAWLKKGMYAVGGAFLFVALFNVALFATENKELRANRGAEPAVQAAAAGGVFVKWDEVPRATSYSILYRKDTETAFHPLLDAAGKPVVLGSQKGSIEYRVVNPPAGTVYYKVVAHTPDEPDVEGTAVRSEGARPALPPTSTSTSSPPPAPVGGSRAASRGSRPVGGSGGSSVLTPEFLKTCRELGSCPP